MVEDFTRFYLQSYLLRTPFGKGSHPSSRTGSQEVLHEVKFKFCFSLLTIRFSKTMFTFTERKNSLTVFS